MKTRTLAMCVSGIIGLAAGSAMAAPTGWQLPYTSGNSPDSPLLFNFNESSGSVGTNEGTAGSTHNGTYNGNNASTNVASGAGVPASGFGNALNLTGSNYFSFPSVNAGDVTTTGFIVEAWFKIDSAPTGNGYGYIVNDYDPSNSAGGYPDGRHYTLSIHNGGGNAYLDFSAVRTNGEWVAFDADDIPVSFGEWHHAAAQYVPGDRWELYLDGVLKKTSDQEPSVDYTHWEWTSPTTPNTVYVGAYNSSIGVGNFLGQIDGVRISAIPEPASLSLLALGGLAMMRRRRA